MMGSVNGAEKLGQRGVDVHQKCPDLMAQYISAACTPEGCQNFEINVVNDHGSGKTHETQNSFDDVLPSWSPDGETLALDSLETENFEIFVMNDSGTDRSVLTFSGDDDSGSLSTHKLCPVWPPDGTRIAIATGAYSDSNGQIHVMNALGTQQWLLTDQLDGLRGLLAWSPDGNRIMFLF